MTRTYLDMDASMQLLEEHERDLELATQMGQMLLSKNKEVTQQKEVLEKKLTFALEVNSQLRHEVNNKEQLLCFYADAEINSADNVSLVKHVNEKTHTFEELLHGKVEQLEKDKGDLMEEKSLLVAHTKEIRNKGHALVSYAQAHLNILQSDLQSANSQMQAVTNELSSCKHETHTQSYEISSLLNQIAELQKKHSQLLTENEDMQHQLVNVNESHDELSQDLQNLKKKYHEALDVLEETHEEMYMLHNTNAHSDSANDNSHKVLPLSCSISRVSANCSGYANQNASPYTLSIPRPLIKSFSQHKQGLSSEMSEKNTIDKFSIVTGHEVQVQLCSTPVYTSMALNIEQKWPHYIQTRKRFVRPFSQESSSLDMGQPGVPGTTDLAQAIDDLAHIGNGKLRAVEQAKKILATKQNFKRNDYLRSCTPKSSPKLRLVKPLEGSAMLQKWKILAVDSSCSPTLINTSMKVGILHRHSLTGNQNIYRNFPNISECIGLQNVQKKLCFSETPSPPAKSSAPGLASRQEKGSRFPKLAQRISVSHSLTTMTSQSHIENKVYSHATIQVSVSCQPEDSSFLELTQLHGSNKNYNFH